MPRVDFSSLPDHARVWIFASDRPLPDEEAGALLAEVDAFLARWQAHGAPLRSARDWKERRFLVIGVDPTAEQASGCSIDGLFRSLQALESAMNTRLVAGGRVFYRDERGDIQLAARADVARALRADTPVFDTAITDAGTYRSRFESPASATWVAGLLGHASQSSSRAVTNSSSARKG